MTGNDLYDHELICCICKYSLSAVRRQKGRGGGA